MSMIEDAEMRGELRKGSQVVEASSGNTGIALAFICAAKGYPISITMPENGNKETIHMLQSLGATVHLTPAHRMMKGAIDKALELVESLPGAYMPMQFNNPANPRAHFDLTGPEIWNATDGGVDAFIAGVGTGGTITGVGQFLKSRSSDIEIVAVEPADAAVLSGEEAGFHQILGIGAGFVPEILDRDVIDAIHPVHYADCAKMCQRMAHEEGILVGVSSGANLVAAFDYASRPENTDKTVVTILCDTGERYLSTPLFEKGDA